MISVLSQSCSLRSGVYETKYFEQSLVSGPRNSRSLPQWPQAQSCEGHFGARKELLLNAFVMTIPGQLLPGLWKHPRYQTENCHKLSFWTSLAQKLDAEGFHAMFIAETLGPDDVHKGPTATQTLHWLLERSSRSTFRSAQSRRSRR